LITLIENSELRDACKTDLDFNYLKKLPVVLSKLDACHQIVKTGVSFKQALEQHGLLPANRGYSHTERRNDRRTKGLHKCYKKTGRKHKFKKCTAEQVIGMSIYASFAYRATDYKRNIRRYVMILQRLMIFIPLFVSQKFKCVLITFLLTKVCKTQWNEENHSRNP
jgi:hypothetical protein